VPIGAACRVFSVRRLLVPVGRARKFALFLCVSSDPTKKTDLHFLTMKIRHSLSPHRFHPLVRFCLFTTVFQGGFLVAEEATDDTPPLPPLKFIPPPPPKEVPPMVVMASSVVKSPTHQMTRSAVKPRPCPISRRHRFLDHLCRGQRGNRLSSSPSVRPFMTTASAM
jgi:hypothetical protein